MFPRSFSVATSSRLVSGSIEPPAYGKTSPAGHCATLWAFDAAPEAWPIPIANGSDFHYWRVIRIRMAIL
jgi:hypothetical protein